ncbi:MAG: hypothetical protein ABI151_06455, partial [Chitinophagaceae bacterium]
DQGGHFGYAYIDNLFTSNCPPPGDIVPKEGDVRLNVAKTDLCATGNICASYALPYVISPTGVRTTGTATISLNLFQNGRLMETITGPAISSYSSDSTFCFDINPAVLGINNFLAGFDYTLTGTFVLSGFNLSPKIVGNPGVGIKIGTNNDYFVACATADPDTYYSKPTGDLNNTLSWGKNMDGSGINPPDFGAGKTFQLANRGVNYMLTADWTVGGKLNIPPGSQLQISSFTLSVADLLGSGGLSGTSMSNLTVTTPSSGGTSLDFMAAANNLKNLVISSTATTSLASMLNVYGVLDAQAGTLNTSNSLTLKSTAANTASVAPVMGSIMGSVTVERYIPARRAWRIMSAPVNGSQSINSAWQEASTTSSGNSNPMPGYGTHITEGDAGMGFDHNPLIAMTSVKKYMSASDAWVPLANTNGTPVNADAYLLFVRGDRSIPLGLNTVPANNTTLRAQGPLKTGNQMFPVSANGFTAIPNPFAAPINFQTLTRTNVQNNFYLWDPKMGGTDGVGGYVLLSFNGSTYDMVPSAVSPESQYIQSGQGFLVHSTGTAGSITIKESDKSGTAAANVFRVNTTAPANGSPFASNISTTTSGLRISLQSIGTDSKPAVLDEVFSSYGNNYSDKIDNLDAEKMFNIEENLAINSEGHTLMAERSRALEETDKIQLKIWNLSSEKSYLLEINP